MNTTAIFMITSSSATCTALVLHFQIEKEKEKIQLYSPSSCNSRMCAFWEEDDKTRNSDKYRFTTSKNKFTTQLH